MRASEPAPSGCQLERSDAASFADAKRCAAIRCHARQRDELPALHLPRLLVKDTTAELQGFRLSMLHCADPSRGY